MESSFNHAEGTELLAIMLHVAESALLWALIVLSTIRLILSWLIGNLTICVLVVCQGMISITRSVPGAMRTFLTWFWEMRSALSHIPGLCLAFISTLYQQVSYAVVSCLAICKSVPLQKDDLCDQISRGGVACLAWTHQYCLSTQLCHYLWTKVSLAAQHMCQVFVVRFQSLCPAASHCLVRCSTGVIGSGLIPHLGYVSSRIFKISLLHIRQIWTFIAWLVLTVTASLLRQLDLRHVWSRICCSSSMTRWRMLHLRCSPRSGFYAILVFVAFTFVLTTYLYSGSFIDVTEHTKSVQHQVPPQHFDDLWVRHISPHKQSDRFVKPGNRHRIQHHRREQPAEEAWQHPSTPAMKQVLDVINLMSQLRSHNESSTLGIQKQMLRKQIKSLREAMTSKHTMLPKPPTLPACVGNLQLGEVEDILCIPRPKFLSHIKNPCWYAERASSDGEKSMHCLPYFHILGCAKSGTTDLWNRLMSHPHTVSNDGLLHKEALWWSWYRYGISGYKRKMHVQNFTDYVSLFQDTARQIKSSIDKETLFHQILITGDASPPDFWDFRGWTNISQNRQYNVPMVITPHLMRHIYANPKFIIMFRDPIDRLYSDYFFVGLGLTAQDFHNDILASVDMLAQCIEQYGLQRCFYDHDLYIKLPVRLPFACYSVFMREWLQIFPLENFLFIKTEEYDLNPEDTLKSVMDFLGLGPLKDTQLQVIAEEERSRVTVQRQIAGPMMNASKVLLEELLGDCNIELRKLVRSDKFTWSWG